MASNILFLYFQWHFWDRPRSILGVWRNCLKFNLNYWSVPLLFKTLFSHWRRYQYSYGRGFDLRRYFEAFSFNVISRTLGASMRIVLIVLGLLTEVFVFLAGVVVFLTWLLLPLFLVWGIYYGFKILI